MKDYGEIPGGKKELKPLLYPFHRLYPFKIWSKYRWFKNSRLRKNLPHLNSSKKWITVVDRLGAPGDALITSNVIRCIKNQYPELLVNCITPNPAVIRLDPDINSLNQPETFYSFDSSYWELIVRKDSQTNIINHNMSRLAIDEWEYKAKYYVSKGETNWAKKQLIKSSRPLLGICTKSKEPVKNWSQSNWLGLIQNLKSKFSIIHIGDDREPIFDSVVRFAGKTTIRESAALLSLCDLFVGPDSLLMHIANGLDIPSIIIFGGSRPVECFGYNENINLSSSTDCSPCWMHKGYESCNENMKCMTHISIEIVLNKTMQMLNKLQN